MTDADLQRLTSLLQEIRDNQRIQVERQAEALALQRQQFDLVQRQAVRAERIQDRAEAIQEKGASLVTASRRALAVILPIVVVLIAWLSWLLLRR